MKQRLSLEIFGDNTRQMMRLWTMVLNERMEGLGNMVVGKLPSSCWVAEITGEDPKYGLARTFVRFHKDYSASNSIGSRGIRAEYILESGHIYEVSCKTSWKSIDRYFCRIADDGTFVRMEREDVMECLNTHLE